MSDPSTSAQPNETGSELETKECQVCNQPAHGKHFGAVTCRACAAFFRRTKIGQTIITECVENETCRPKFGKWACKNCRLQKCLALGMTPENIQYNRDLFRNAETVPEVKKQLMMYNRLPTTMERVLGKAHILVYLNREPSQNHKLTYVDLTEVMDRVKDMLISKPLVVNNTSQMSTLEKLAFALKEVRKAQQRELSEIKAMGKSETLNLWHNDLTTVAKWMMHSGAFSDLSVDLRLSLFKAMWHLWTKMERIAMTAEMRMNRMCGKKQFVISHHSLIDLDDIRDECAWHSQYTPEEMRMFVNPFDYYCDVLVDSYLELQPTEVELIFLICNLCFQVIGKKLGDEMERVTERLLETISNDIHHYYAEKNEFPRYAHRLTKLLRICNEYQKLMHQRQDRMEVASALNAFRIGFSHPELFMFSH